MVTFTECVCSRKKLKDNKIYIMTVQRLFAAIRGEDVEGVRTLLTEIIDVNTVEPNVQGGNTPLHLACTLQQTEIVELLLNANADLNLKTDDDLTALQCVLESASIFKIDMDLVKLLIEAGADVNSVNKLGRSALHLVCDKEVKNRGKEAAWAEYLISRGANVHMKSFQVLSPLHYASRWWKRNSLPVVKVLIQAGADVNDKSKGDWTALHFAASTNFLPTVEYLLSIGARVEDANNLGETPLHRVCASNISKNNCFGTVKCLMRHNANINALDNLRETPLLLFLKNLPFFNEYLESREYTLRFLLKYSDANVEDRLGVNILSCITIGLNHDFKSDELRNTYGRIILEHLAKLHALNITVKENILRYLSYNNYYVDYFTQCKEELVKAKNMKFQKSWVSYFNLLVDNKTKLKNYAGNKDLVKEFQANDCSEIFPIYGASMKENVDKGVTRRQLFDGSAELLSNNWPIFSPSHLIIRAVLDCLSTKDLNKLK